jgi:hypothetical protein
MHSNLERLSKTFRRPILGVHNPSFGIPFDVLECILQRTFAYPTLDIRNAYTTLSALLADDDITKLVLIAHSQGSIEAGMVLDWLYATLPSKYVKKLEVFTFGNAANHWNCPIDDQGPLIKHVEHYANEGDWVARFGILHFRQSRDETASADPALKDSGRKQHFWNPQTPVIANGKSDVRKQSTFELEGKRAGMHRFVGRLFKRAGSGHQMNQHYLDNIFVMDEKLTKVVDSYDATTSARGGAVSFMDMPVDMELLHRDDTVMPKTQTSSGSRSTHGVKVKELSRLWTYRNGRTPDDWVHHGRNA